MVAASRSVAGQLIHRVVAMMTMTMTATTLRTSRREQMMFKTLARLPCWRAPSRSPSTLQSRACGGKWRAR